MLASYLVYNRSNILLILLNQADLKNKRMDIELTYNTNYAKQNYPFCRLNY